MPSNPILPSSVRQVSFWELPTARLEHMTKAAHELHIDQPALSMTIARLENDLGVPLFDPQGRQIRLNVYGKAFLIKAEKALQVLEEGRREIAEMSGLEHGRVSLAVTTLTRFSKLLGAFLSEYPNISFRVIQAPTEETKLASLFLASTAAFLWDPMRFSHTLSVRYVIIVRAELRASLI